MLVSHFNARPRHQREKKKPALVKPYGTPVLEFGFTIDPDFDNLGTDLHPDIKVAPGLTAHLGFSGGAVDAVLERDHDYAA